MNENPSESHSLPQNNYPHKQTMIINYQERTQVVHNASLFIGFILLLFGLFYPWAHTRNTGYASETNIHKLLLKQQTQQLAIEFNNTLNTFKMITRFIVRLTQKPIFLDSNLDHIQRFIKLTSSSFNFIQPKPRRFILGKGYDFYFEVLYNSYTDYECRYLYKTVSDGKSQYILKQYNQFIDYSNFSQIFESEGTVLETFTESPINYPAIQSNVNNYHLWKTLLRKKVQDFDEFFYLSIVDPTSNDSFYSISTVSPLYFQEVLNSILNFTPFHQYYVLDQENKIIFSNEKNSNETLYLSNDTFMSYAYSIAENDTDAVSEFEYNDIKYIVKITPLMINNHKYATILMIFSLDEAIEDNFKSSTNNFLITISIEGILYFFTVWFLKHNERKTGSNDLQISTPSDSCSSDDILQNCGTIGSTINNLTALRIKYSDEIVLNKVIDNVVNNLAKQPTRHYFGLTDSSSSQNLSFCENLLKESPVEDIPDSKFNSSFSFWRKISLSGFKRYPKLNEPLENLKFNIEAHMQQPRQQLFSLLLTIMDQDNLVFEKIDPDWMVSKLYDFSFNRCKVPITAANTIYNTYYLTHKSLKDFTLSRIDLLSFYTVILFAYSGYETSCFEGHEMSEPITQMEKIIPGFTEHFQSYIDKIPNDPFFMYIQYMVLGLANNLDEKKQLDTLGQFRIRIEEKDFSTDNNIENRLLFMKVLLRFCLFSPYWSSVETMEEIMKEAPSLMMPNLEQEIDDIQFISSYQYYISTSIVYLWINVFQCLKIELTKIHENYDKILQFWKEFPNTHRPMFWLHNSESDIDY